METKKDVSYLGKDFGQFRKILIEFTKQYFPKHTLILTNRRLGCYLSN
jgi:hypothetical protein